MNLSGQKVLVVGMGRTGEAVVRFLVNTNARIYITDIKPETEQAEFIRKLKEANVHFSFLPYERDSISGMDMIIPSPGVPPFDPLLVEGTRRGVRIISELELAFRYMTTPLIAVTGTNGKTTTTTLLGDVLSHWGKKVHVCGNIGSPVISYVAGNQIADYVVAEVSSFQLQWIETFCPDIAILLNTTPDHIDYHGSMKEYRRIKERIFCNQTKEKCAIVNGDDPAARAIEKQIGADLWFFSSSGVVKKGMNIFEGHLEYKENGVSKEKYPLDAIRLKGKHNFENIMAVILAARRCGCPHDMIMEILEKFSGLAHRIEFAGRLGGVDYYNDSKGTNVDAVLRALESFSESITLLLGGRDKKGDFSVLQQAISQKVKHLVLFGEAKEKIGSFVNGWTDTRYAGNLEAAIQVARQYTLPGEIVLLSPGCSSFDEFKNYEERGTFFRNVVARMIKEENRNS